MVLPVMVGSKCFATVIIFAGYRFSIGKASQGLTTLGV